MKEKMDFSTIFETVYFERGESLTDEISNIHVLDMLYPHFTYTMFAIVLNFVYLCRSG